MLTGRPDKAPLLMYLKTYIIPTSSVCNCFISTLPSFHPSPPFPSLEMNLQLVATPDYPVAAGQKVELHCRILPVPHHNIWSWQRWQNQTWKDVGESDMNLTLTKPEESGRYCCYSKASDRRSPEHAVYIVAMKTKGSACI